jgi:plastocyanin domain-containing protein
MKKYISIVVTLVLVVGIGYILLQNPNSDKVPKDSNLTGPGILSSIPSTSPNVTVKDGVQYITVNAKGGYSPRISTAKGGIPTRLIVKTDNTYDCSSSLVVKAAGYRGMLPATGETVVEITTTPISGETVQGICGMGMYNFNVKFN